MLGLEERGVVVVEIEEGVSSFLWLTVDEPESGKLSTLHVSRRMAPHAPSLGMALLLNCNPSVSMDRCDSRRGQKGQYSDTEEKKMIKTRGQKGGSKAASRKGANKN